MSFKAENELLPFLRYSQLCASGSRVAFNFFVACDNHLIVNYFNP